MWSATAKWLTPGGDSHPDAVLGSRRYVNRVVADAKARDDLEPRRRREHALRELVRGADDGVAIGDGFEQLFLG